MNEETSEAINNEEHLKDETEVIVVEQAHASHESSLAQNKRESFSSFLNRMFKKCLHVFRLLSAYFWRILELHLYKFTIFVIGIFCFNKVNLINLVLLCATLLSLMVDKTGTSEKRVQTIFLGFVQIWTVICVVATMIFQLKFIQSPFVFNCNGTFVNQSTVDPFLLENHDSFTYIGIEKVPLILENIKVKRHYQKESQRILKFSTHPSHPQKILTPTLKILTPPPASSKNNRIYLKLRTKIQVKPTHDILF